MSDTDTLTAFLGRAYAAKMRLRPEQLATVKAEFVAAIAADPDLRAAAAAHLAGIDRAGRDPQRNIIGATQAEFLGDALAQII